MVFKEAERYFRALKRNKDNADARYYIGWQPSN